MMNENIADMSAEFQLSPAAMESTSEIEISVQFDPESLPADTLLAADVEVTELEPLETVSSIDEEEAEDDNKNERCCLPRQTLSSVISRTYALFRCLAATKKSAWRGRSKRDKTKSSKKRSHRVWHSAMRLSLAKRLPQDK